MNKKKLKKKIKRLERDVRMVQHLARVAAQGAECAESTASRAEEEASNARAAAQHVERIMADMPGLEERAYARARAALDKLYGEALRGSAAAYERLRQTYTEIMTDEHVRERVAAVEDRLSGSDREHFSASPE